MIWFNKNITHLPEGFVSFSHSRTFSLQLPALHHQKAWVPKMGRLAWIQLGLRKHRQWWEKISSSDFPFKAQEVGLLLSALIIAAKFWFFQSPGGFPGTRAEAERACVWRTEGRLPQDGSSPTWPFLTTFRQPGPGTRLMMETFVAISAVAAGTVFIPSADMQIVVGGRRRVTPLTHHLATGSLLSSYFAWCPDFLAERLMVHRAWGSTSEFSSFQFLMIP